MSRVRSCTAVVQPAATISPVGTNTQLPWASYGRYTGPDINHRRVHLYNKGSIRISRAFDDQSIQTKTTIFFNFNYLFSHRHTESILTFDSKSICDKQSIKEIFGNINRSICKYFRAFCLYQRLHY